VRFTVGGGLPARTETGEILIEGGIVGEIYIRATGNLESVRFPGEWAAVDETEKILILPWALLFYHSTNEIRSFGYYQTWFRMSFE